MRDCARALVLAVVLVLAAIVAARAQSSPSPGSVQFLDVPYIEQSEALCGGAAVAMVMRYWGATGVYAETFAPLLDKAAGGIHGADLLRELGGRGWDARSFRGDRAFAQARLASRQPVIALIEDRPGTYHYVVVVAWTNGRVVYHDPARAPYRVVSEDAFLKAWSASQFWTLLALPPKSLNRPTVSATEGVDFNARATAASACSTLVADGVDHANRGHYATALEHLRAAADGCPADAAPWREMAGVFAVKESWGEAARYAREAVRRDAADTHSWRILATSRYLTDDFAGALDAWNAVGEPVLDIVNVRGLEHIRHGAASSAMRLTTQTVLTREALVAAGRRLSEVPAAQVSRVNYRPLEGGRAAVDAVLIERPRSPFGLSALAIAGLRAVSTREITLATANPTGAGDLASASWRWWENRPRIGASYAAPLSVGGVLRVDVYRDEQTYGAQRTREVRRGGAVSFADWTTTNTRWEVSLGVDDWSTRGRLLALGGAIEQRAWRDHLSLTANGTMTAGQFSEWATGIGVQWRSSVRNEGQTVLARLGVDIASEAAPLALWPGAGVGHARPTLLRAHPLLDDGVITGEAFGRRVYSGGAEWRRWTKPIKGVIRVAPAVFVDAAHAEQRLVVGDAWHVDAGAGVRIAIPGSEVFRVDIAKGLRDGNTRISIGWTR
jgi:hypothetical protein